MKIKLNDIYLDIIFLRIYQNNNKIFYSFNSLDDFIFLNNIDKNNIDFYLNTENQNDIFLDTLKFDSFYIDEKVNENYLILFKDII